MLLLKALGALEEEGSAGGGDLRLSAQGRTMAALPLDPPLSAILLRACAAGAGVEALALVSLLSTEGLWVSPGREKAGAFAQARAKFACAEGDHLTSLSAFFAFERVVSSAAREAGRESGGGGKVSGSGGRVVTVAAEGDAEGAAEVKDGGKRGAAKWR